MRYIVSKQNYPLQMISKIEGIRKVSSWPSVSLDIETSGDINHIDTQSISLLQLSNGLETVVFTHSFEEVLKKIQKKLIIGHNLKFDLRVIYKAFGLTFSRVFDTMLAVQILDCGLPTVKGKHTLETVARRFYDPYAYTNQGSLFEVVVTKKVRDSFLGVKDNFTIEQLTYAAKDAEVTYGVYLKLLPILKQEELLQTVRFECRFLLVLVEAEARGIYLDSIGWLKASEKAYEDMMNLLEQLSELADINWNSPSQILKQFKEWGIPVSYFNHKEMVLKESVSKTALAGLENHPIVGVYLRYSVAKKKCSTYGQGFLDKYVSPVDGRVHTSFKQIMDTGRTSSSSPNCQNIPREKLYREAFQAKEGYVLLSADYSSQEVHVAADRAKEKNLIQFLLDKKDPHLEVAKLVFNNPDLIKESEERQIAKSIGFLLIYGGGANKLVEAYGLTLAKAKALIKSYFEAYPEFPKYFDRMGVDAEKNGYILNDNYIGRKTYLYFYETLKFAKAHIDRYEAMGWEPHYKIVDWYGYHRAKLQRLSQNYPIQSTAATMSKLAGILIHKEFKRLGLDAHILLLVHDEWIVECKEEISKEVKEIIESCMKKASEELLTSLSCRAKANISRFWSK